MKAVTVEEARGQLGQLVADACRGELIILSDGDKQVALEPRSSLRLEEDSPELEAELLNAVQGPHSAFTETDLREVADKALAQHRAQRRK